VIAPVAAVSVGLAVGPAFAGDTWASEPMRRGYEERPRGPARIVVRAL
jgi:hypothetical protein